MADYTLNDTMADIRLEYDDRFIYNDIRSSIGTTSTETVVDADPTYSWLLWQEYHSLPNPGYTTFRYFKATAESPIEWRIRNVSAYTYDYEPYADYQIALIDTNETNTKAVELKNTGTGTGTIGYIVEYKYVASEEITHDETVYNTLTVRSTDDASINLYGRRTMNLVWPTGASESQMQGVIDRYLEKHKDPSARAYVQLKGDDDTMRAIIFGAEISKDVQLICAELGLNDTYYIDSIEIHGTPDGIPIATWMCTDKYATEISSLFVLDTSELDGTHKLG